MSLEALLDHTCNIYHVVEGGKSPGYGLMESPIFTYPEDPDLSNVTCHFGVKTQSVTVTQTEPANIMDAKIKVTLPVGTDVRINDKIVDCGTGYEYTAEQPRHIRGHHIFVYVKKKGEQTYL